MTKKEERPILYEITEIPSRFIREEDAELDKEDESEEEEDQEDSEDSEENPSEDEQEDSESEPDEDEDESVPANVYKGLQRTVSKKDKEIDELEDKLKKSKQEKADAEAMLESGDKVRLDLQKTITDQGERLSALETENKQSKLSAMQSKVIAEDFPGLAKLRDYIPSAETEDEYVRIVKA